MDTCGAVASVASLLADMRDEGVRNQARQLYHRAGVLSDKGQANFPISLVWLTGYGAARGLQASQYGKLYCEVQAIRLRDPMLLWIFF